MKLLKIGVAKTEMVRSLVALGLVALILAGLAPSIKTEGAGRQSAKPDAELYQSLLDLTSPWTVMCVAAHPDDEDGATLTVLRRKMGVHTVTLFSTYGEGGQNATGPELYEELGVIRARETAEASEIQGSEPYFLGLRDFGFSKSAEEAFRIWGHDEALRRMVLKIRELRPDVIITNHNTTSGHGHHQATGRLVLEAFDAAADPARFPDQLRDGRLQPWQVQRIFVRFGFGGDSESKAPESDQRVVNINRNEQDPVRGTTYAEQALQALRRHATQGPWPQTLPPQGWPPVRYRLVKEAKGASPLPANAQTFLDNLSIPGEPESKIVPLAVRAVLALYESGRAGRESLVRALASLRQSNVFTAPADSNDKPRFQLMNRRLDKALAAASGITASFRVDGVPLLIPGTEMPYTVTLYNGGDRDVKIKSRAFRFHGSTLSASRGESLLQRDQPFRSTGTASVPRDAFINTPQAEHLYDGRLWGEELSEEFELEAEGATFTVRAAKRFNVSPPVEIQSISPRLLVVTPQTLNDNQSFTFQITNNTTAPVDVRVGTKQLTYAGRAVEPSWKRVPARDSVKDEITYMLSGQDIKAIRERGELSTTARFSLNRVNPTARAPITEREVKIVYADARVDPKLRVGYVRGTDFTLPEALSALGVWSKELTVNEVSAGNLSSYDAIVIDNRGYQAHPELMKVNQKLLEYAEAGGTLIVFYHKNNEWNPDEKAGRPQLAPFPILLGNSRVTDETAPVTFTDPQHPLLNVPNKISARDFEGWIQERGLYFPREWDKRYSAPLSMSDAGEPQLTGGLLAAEYGRGRYIYTSIVWYRQLREGIPGAYRALANMLSYGRTDKGQR
ncbi:MAG TPA: PIG-L family deacetylase [Pyrinomonadaceae bacterium]|nr:PIG-L family deacetylase [Pyrinomonadaceae bacterium]